MLYGERFSEHTTFKTGGVIPLYVEPVDEQDLKLILEFFEIVLADGKDHQFRR